MHARGYFYAVLKQISAPVLFFLISLFIYGVSGSSTPDTPAIFEVIMGVLLILAACIPTTLMRQNMTKPYDWQGIFTLLFVFGLTVPMVVGGVRAHAPMEMVRDVIAFLFLCSPLFFAPLFLKRDDAFGGFQGMVIFIGLCFSVRALLPAYGFYEAPEELLYLANSPLVILSALLLIFRICSDIYKRQITFGTYIIGALSLLPLMAMLIDVQRAPMGAVITGVLCFCAFAFCAAPARAIRVIAAAAIMVGLSLTMWDSIYTEIAGKTARVGLNMRVEELRAVFDTIRVSPWRVLFGNGWGAQFAAPSVGGLSVGYTHSLISYFILKGGMFGLGLICLVCGVVVKKIYHIMHINMPLGLAMAWAFIIPVFFYASHKSFDFGIVLLFIIVWGERLKGTPPLRKNFMGFCSDLPLGFVSPARYKDLSH